MMVADFSKLKNLEKEISSLADDIGGHPFVCGLSISINHSIEGVRVNGHERKVSFPDIKEDFDQICDDFDTIAGILQKIKVKIDDFKLILYKYAICPACMGKQIFNKNRRIINREPLQECTKCKGHGVIQKYKNESL